MMLALHKRKGGLYHLHQSARVLMLVMMIVWQLSPAILLANPMGGEVVQGNANLNYDGSTLTVNQLSDRAILNWQDFSINSGELTKFIQPSAMSAALNRVTGGNPSTIFGTLQANGQVFLIISLTRTASWSARAV